LPDNEWEIGKIMEKQSSKKATQVKRTIAAAAVTGVLAFGFGSSGSVMADSDVPTESYPIPTNTVTNPPVPAEPLPATGTDSTGLWLKVGGGAVLAGGLLVAATARRRNENESTLAS
jgi:LPXTG-motif cell wall-anchored protein